MLLGYDKKSENEEDRKIYREKKKEARKAVAIAKV